MIGSGGEWQDAGSAFYKSPKSKPSGILRIELPTETKAFSYQIVLHDGTVTEKRRLPIEEFQLP